MTDFQKMVIDLLIGMEVMQLIRTVLALSAKLHPLFHSRKKKGVDK